MIGRTAASPLDLVGVEVGRDATLGILEDALAMSLSLG
jgi:hypothetical protein